MLKKRFLIALLFTLFWAETLCAQPITTKYYSLSLPADWVVLNGPSRGGDNVRLQLSDKDRTVTATLIVGSVQPGEAKKAASVYAKQLKVTPRQHAGQTEFLLTHGQERGYYVMREDASSRLMLLLTVSGNLRKADFLFRMRSPYPNLVPKPPLF